MGNIVDYDFKLSDRYTEKNGTVYLTGMQALVRLLIEQADLDKQNGLNTRGYVSGYRGSPVGSFDTALEQAGEQTSRRGIYFNPGVNEDLAATAISGTQQVVAIDKADLDGVFGVWYGKGPGVDRSVDALKHASVAGTSPHGGILLIVGDDQMGKSSSLCHQSEQSLLSANVPILAPSSLHEYISLGLHGFAMSRYSGAVVALKITSDTADGAATIDVENLVPHFAELKEPNAKTTLHYQPGFVPFLEAERIMLEERMPAAVEYARANQLNRTIVETSDKKLGIVAVGAAYLELQAGLELLGIKDLGAMGIGLFKINMLWPLEPTAVLEFSSGYEEILVVEHKRAFVENQLGHLFLQLSDSCRPKLSGKTVAGSAGQERLLSESGELTSWQIANAVSTRAMAVGVQECGKSLKAPAAFDETQPQQRIPWYCAGCPHNSSTKLPQGSMATSGIGCHSISALIDFQKHTWMCQMGGEGQHWLGRAPFSPIKHSFANLGDGTYNHSGSLAIRSAVSSGVNITFKLLYNDAVALTGGQNVDSDHKPWDIAAQLIGEKVSKIEVVSDRPEDFADAPWPPGIGLHHRRELDSIQRQLRDVKGTSVLIYIQTCAAEKRRRRKKGAFPNPPKRILINHRICEGCGDCGLASNCVAIKPLDTVFGTKRVIDQASCNKDFSCKVGFCPSFVMVEGIDGKDPLKRQNRRIIPIPSDINLLTPTLPRTEAPTRVLITGIGGTGVVTIGAILAVAARLEGKHALTLDQTGLSQKNGAVASNVTICCKAILNYPNKIGQGACDVLIACDLLGAVRNEALKTLETNRSKVVVNTKVEPLPHFAKDASARPQTDVLMDRLTSLLPQSNVMTASTSELSEILVGDSLGANMMLTGFAVQQGLLPLGCAAIEQAIRLNAVAIEMNIMAFRWGRCLAQDPNRVEQAVKDLGKPKECVLSLDGLIEKHRAELRLFQNEAYAQKYHSALAHLVDADVKEMAAKALFKVMAYKDEYEVARLALSSDFAEQFGEQIGGRVRKSYYLSPPLLAPRNKVTGQLEKLRVPGWLAEVGFKVLTLIKFVRGTRWDVFGYSQERREERALANEVLSVVSSFPADLSADAKRQALNDLALVFEVKGFGHVKIRHWNAVRSKWQLAVARWVA